MATFFEGGTFEEQARDPVMQLIGSGTYRDIPTYIPREYVAGRLSREEALTRIRGTPTFNAAIGPQIDRGQGVIVQGAQQILDSLQKQGLAINPNIQLSQQSAIEFLKRMESDSDPVFAQFRAKAEQEIGPYYSTQLKLAREGVMRSMGFAAEDVTRQEADLERKYGRQVRELGEQAAEVGFAQSGIRQRAERELAEGTQRELEEKRRDIQFKAGTVTREFAQKYGGAELPSVSLGATPRALPGEAAFQRPGGTSPFYELSPEVYQGLVGSEEFGRRSAIRSRASELEEAFRQQQTLPTRFLSL